MCVEMTRRRPTRFELIARAATATDAATAQVRRKPI
jgi:hypothetical protein